MSTDDTYQGWTNRETWALMLHTNNDEGLYHSARAWVSEALNSDLDVVNYIEIQFTDLLDPILYRDEYGTEQSDSLVVMAREVGSLWRVNWTEVVEALTED